MSILFIDYRLLRKSLVSFILYHMDSDKFLKMTGARIRAVRKSKGLSQEKLAEQAGLHPTYISDVENGKVNASLYSYFVIVRALGIPLSELLDMPGGEADEKVETGISELLGALRSLNKKTQLTFLSAAKGLIAGLKKGR